MFDLNASEFSGGSAIFNNAEGGKVDNVTITVEKKAPTDEDRFPDYKVIITDQAGGKINAGFYYPTIREGQSAEDFGKRAVREVGRVVSIAKAVLGRDAQMPVIGDNNTPVKEGAKLAFDTLFKLIGDNAAGKNLSVYVTYGSKEYPKQYLELRYFDFIENMLEPTGRLSQKKSDLLEKVVQDQPMDDGFSAPKSAPAVQSWGK